MTFSEGRKEQGLEKLHLLAMLSHFLPANRIIDSPDNIVLGEERTLLNHIILLNVYSRI
jgi:hypothetical protein